MRIRLWPWLLLGAVLLVLVVRTPFDDLPPIYAPPDKFEREEGLSTGTAFSLGDGIWVTAAHVIDQCDGIYLVDQEEQGWAVQTIFLHEDADAGLIVSDLTRPGLHLTPPDEPLEKDDFGLHMGFPSGEATAFETSLTGTLLQRASEDNNTLVPLQAWHDVLSPADQLYFGLSGGPVFAEDGRVVGIAASVAQSDGVNTIISVHGSIIKEMLETNSAANPSPPYAKKGTPIANTARFVSDTFRQEQVVLVLCAKH